MDGENELDGTAGEVLEESIEEAVEERPDATDAMDTPDVDAPDDRPGATTGDAALAEEVDPASGETATVTERRTRRWYGIGFLSLFALGTGVITGVAAPLLVGVFGIAFAGYATVTAAPMPDIAVERRVDEVEPSPGDPVRVTVDVTNEGSRPLFDLRFIDGVPQRIGVVDGTPRHGGVLMPGASTTFSYTVRAERGEHTFERLTVLARDVAGATERVVAVGERTTLGVTPELPSDPPAIPLRKKVSQFTGRFPGDTGGPGIEFHATRRYRRGDPLSRVDWRRTARTGELTTVEYRVERTVRVCLVFDTRTAAHVGPDPHHRSAVERAVDGGVEAYAGLIEAGHDVGIGAIAPTDCWLPPGSGDQHWTAARQLFATSPALSARPPDEEANIYQTTQRLKGRLSGDAQILLFSPLTDDRILDTAVRLDAHGFAVTVVSPDPTDDETTGQVYGRLQRRLRIADVRSRAIPVVDWKPDEDLSGAIARITERWSA